MKISRICGALAMAAVTAASAWASPTNKFDLNNDGRVDGRDSEMLIMMIGNLGTTGSMPALPGSVHDLNGDGVLSFKDWRVFVQHVSAVGAHPDALFDVSSPGMAPLGVTFSDKARIAMAIGQGTVSPYAMRFDFNADGVLNIRDWMMFVGHYKKVEPALLLDVDGNGIVNGRDLDRFAQAIDVRSFDVMLDLNGDRALSAADWQAAVQLANAINPRAVFDVDNPMNTRAGLSVEDGQRISTNLNGLAVGFPTSIRFDLNGDGRVTAAADWLEWVRYVTLVAKQPDLLFDVNGDGIVMSMDVGMINSAVGSFPVQVQYDVNGDGAINVHDAAIVTARLSFGPIQMIAGDVNRDGCVDSKDLGLVQAAQGAIMGSTTYDPDLDLNSNGYIGSDDLSIVNSNMGRCR